jgi:hypothetical protein
MPRTFKAARHGRETGTAAVCPASHPPDLRLEMGAPGGRALERANHYAGKSSFDVG